LVVQPVPPVGTFQKFLQPVNSSMNASTALARNLIFIVASCGQFRLPLSNMPL
jgi:hypothetical protein